MPTLLNIRRCSWRFSAAACGAALTLTGGAWLPATAGASRSQIAIIQDVHDAGAPSDPQPTLAHLRELGASTVRVIMPWAALAPNPESAARPSFDASDPSAYPSSGWAGYDAVVQTAQQDGLTVDLVVSGGAPRWAEGRGAPSGARTLGAWKPNARAYGEFVRAVGVRYGGHFTPSDGVAPLPAVKFWTIFEEPNFGQHLAPQGIDGSRVSAAAPMMYRSLVNAGFNALKATGHRHDTILIGELNAHGYSAKPSSSLSQGEPGNFGVTKPLPFLRTLFCVDSGYHALRGSVATSEGCPTSAAGSMAFRGRNPGLFEAGGIGDHPEPGNRSPVTDGTSDPNFATVADLGRLENTLDKVNEAYGSRRKYAIYSDEYGYITHPPGRGPYVSPTIAAYYDNWAEFLSWKHPRVASYMQYLLDPASTSFFSHFDNGLETASGQPKLTYSAYVLPLYLPRTSFPSDTNVEIWGAARPAPFMQHDGNGPQTVSMQLNNKTISTIPADGPGGYFDLHTTFATSGTVRLAYTYPSSDPFLPVGTAGATVYSRNVAIKLIDERIKRKARSSSNYASRTSRAGSL